MAESISEGTLKTWSPAMMFTPSSRPATSLALAHCEEASVTSVANDSLTSRPSSSKPLLSAAGLGEHAPEEASERVQGAEGRRAAAILNAEMSDGDHALHLIPSKDSFYAI